MDALANLPAHITRHRVIGPKATAAFLGITVSQLRRLRSEGRVPQPIQFSPRIYGWKVHELINWLDKDLIQHAVDQHFNEMERDFLAMGVPF